MFNKSNGKKNLVGLDIGSSSIKAVELQRKGSTYQLVQSWVSRTCRLTLSWMARSWSSITFQTSSQASLASTKSKRQELPLV